MLHLLENYSPKLLKNRPNRVTLFIVVVIVWVRVSQKNFPQFSSRFPIGRSVPLSKKYLSCSSVWETATPLDGSASVVGICFTSSVLYR